MWSSSLDLEKNCFVHWPQANVFCSWESRWLDQLWPQVFILEVMTKKSIQKYDVKYMTHVFHYLGGKLTVAADKFDLHIILCTRGNTYKVLKQTGRLRASVYSTGSNFKIHGRFNGTGIVWLYIIYIPYRLDISPRRLLVLGGPKIGPYLGFETIFTFFIQLQWYLVWTYIYIWNQYAKAQLMSQ